MIEFFFEGKKYQVEDSAYYRSLIVLPNKIVIQPTSWLESNPPVAVGLRRVPILLEVSMTANELARWLGAPLAVEFSSVSVEVSKFQVGLSYRLAAPTLLTIFCSDEDRLWKIDSLLRKNYGAYGSGPAVYGIPGHQSCLTFGFRRKEDLNRARVDFGFPCDFQAGPPIYT